MQASVNAALPAGKLARSWSGFALGREAAARLTADPEHPEKGLHLLAGAQRFARESYAREPLASNALFVLAVDRLATPPAASAYDIAARAAELDKRNPLIALMLIDAAAKRGDLPDMFGRMNAVAAVHPELSGDLVQALLESLGDPASIRPVVAALAKEPPWASAFRSRVPAGPGALRNYLTVRRQMGVKDRWQGDGPLIAALVRQGLYAEALAFWRELSGPDASRFGFSASADLAPIGWQLATRGNRYARMRDQGEMEIAIAPGAGGEVARQLLRLPAGRYRLDVTLARQRGDGLLTSALACAEGSNDTQRKPLGPVATFEIGESPCRDYWLVLSASALDSQDGLEATLSNWKWTRLERGTGARADSTD